MCLDLTYKLLTFFCYRNMNMKTYIEKQNRAAITPLIREREGKTGGPRKITLNLWLKRVTSLGALASPP